jgi:hypothetical protein
VKQQHNRSGRRTGFPVEDRYALSFNSMDSGTGAIAARSNPLDDHGS